MNTREGRSEGDGLWVEARAAVRGENCNRLGELCIELETIVAAGGKSWSERCDGAMDRVESGGDGEDCWLAGRAAAS
jgi:hypothetical protein